MAAVNEPNEPPSAPAPSAPANNAASAAAGHSRPAPTDEAAPAPVSANEIAAELDSRPEPPLLSMHPARTVPQRPPDNGPAMLASLWIIWLLASLAMAFRFESTPLMLRWCVFAAGLGAMLLWPAFRLSSALGPTPRDATIDEQTRPASTVLFEWLCMMLIMQIVVWPLRVKLGYEQALERPTAWTTHQTAWVLAALASWSLLTAAFVALGSRTHSPRGRAAAMAACALLYLGEPALMAIVNLSAGPAAGTTWRMYVSPIQAFWEMSDAPVNWAPAVWRPRVEAIAAAAAAAWAVVGLLGLRRSEAQARQP